MLFTEQIVSETCEGSHSKLDPAVSLGSFHLPTGVTCFRLESNLGEERQREYLTPLAEKETK